MIEARAGSFALETNIHAIEGTPAEACGAYYVGLRTGLQRCPPNP
jgi:hypothetical protein